MVTVDDAICSCDPRISVHNMATVDVCDLQLRFTHPPRSDHRHCGCCDLQKRSTQPLRSQITATVDDVINSCDVLIPHRADHRYR